jgi:DNA invertase Pin-like site-specific DNA recombinase
VTKLDQLARSVGDLLNIVALLETKKVSLRVLSMSGSQPLDTGTATGRLMLAVIGAVGQAERETMLERQREGIAKAQREGKYKGRAPTVRRRADEIVRLKDAGVTPTEIAVRLGIGRASVYRVLAVQVGGECEALTRLDRAQHLERPRFGFWRIGQTLKIRTMSVKTRWSWT